MGDKNEKILDSTDATTKSSSRNTEPTVESGGRSDDDPAIGRRRPRPQ